MSKHDDLIDIYCEQCKKYAHPWKRWESFDKNDGWMTLESPPEWLEDVQYRQKQMWIVINDLEVPEPHKGVLKDGFQYFAVSFSEKSQYEVVNNYVDAHYYQKVGLLHVSMENAQLHTQALLSFTKRNEH